MSLSDLLKSTGFTSALIVDDAFDEVPIAADLESLIDRFVEQLDQVFMLRVFHVDTIC